MKLYLTEDKGVWGDSCSHVLPTTVEVLPYVGTGIVDINGSPHAIKNGTFELPAETGALRITVNGKRCESLLSTERNGVTRACATGEDWRCLLPLLVQLASVKRKVDRHEAQLNKKDLFG
ncbi:MAG: hypothetical protein E7663_04715 [Ruminococcaceae bacterium]|nr:hypothetical protein [Oscillospiraceae bacterium]